jgi:hypothetical protein
LTVALLGVDYLGMRVQRRDSTTRHVEVTVSTERLPADIPVPIINEVAHLMARDAETRPRLTYAERLAAEDDDARRYLRTLPEDDVE